VSGPTHFVGGSPTATQCGSSYSGNTATDAGGVAGDDNDVFGTIGSACAPPPSPCAKPQGYWKTTPGAWPVSSLTLGSQSYSKSQLINLMKKSNTKDASLILADQLIGAKLNVANGVQEPQPVADAIASADALFAQLPGSLPYGVRPQTALGQQMVAIGSLLDSYNNTLTAGCTP
jgi:hypothetical protein